MNQCNDAMLVERPAQAEVRPLLSVRSLRTSFLNGDTWTPVVKDISFEVMPGQTVAIVGESGSGKSVTAMSILRLLSPENARVQGSVELCGQDVLTLDEERMRQLRGNVASMIFQEAMTSLNPVLTIGRQIAEALTLHKQISRADARMEALRLLERVRIPAPRKRLDDYAHNFSGGMRQRAMIAMALACKPKLLIADEPTTALDVTVQAQILDLIEELQREEQMSVLFITHDMGVVAEIAERSIVMLKGEIVEDDLTENIFRHPVHPYTRALLAAVPRLGSMKGASSPKPFAATGAAQTDPGQEKAASERVGEKPILEVRGLTKRFDVRSGPFRKVVSRVHAVENVSFDLHSSETLSIVGESGSGKSTLGRAVMRLTEPTAGTVNLAGRDLTRMPAEALRLARGSIQMIFQDPLASLSPRRTVGEAVAEPFLTHRLGTAKDARELTADLLLRVGLDPDMATRLPHQLSGGQRQRICIARALSLSPKIIVADESVSALDVSVKAQIVDLLIALQRKLGISYLFISHDMAVVERVSHRVAVMFLGEIVEIGPRDAIFSDPRHPYTRQLIDAVPLADPSCRGARRQTVSDEIKNPLRSPDYVPPLRTYEQVGTDHYVLRV